MKTEYEVIIVGSGPAGLFAGISLSEAGIMDVLIIDQLRYPAGGLINDGKLNFDYRIGIDLEELQIEKEEAQQLIEKVKGYFVKFPECQQVTFPQRNKKIEWWKEVAEEHGMEFIAPEQWHYGTDNSKKIVDFLRTFYHGEILLGWEVIEIETWQDKFKVKIQSHGKEIKEIKAAILLIAPGRKGAYWWKRNAEKLGIKTKFGRIDVGIRIELNRKIYDRITDVVYDPKFKFKTRRHRDRIRTFCTNPGGRVRTEDYDGFKLVNGDALAGKKTQNTNFALLNTIGLTKPFSDSTEFGLPYFFA
jgi:hypothetical protein